MTSNPKGTEFGPWNPGIKSQLPTALHPLLTIFQPENALVSADEARELADFTGLNLFELATFRPERLAVHELLVRITADFSVPDGPNYEDLGISFRDIARTILSRHLEARWDVIHQIYDDLNNRATQFIENELTQTFYGTAKPSGKKSIWHRILKKGNKRSASRTAPSVPGFSGERLEPALTRWRAQESATDDPMARAAYDALIRIVSAIGSRHGRLRGDKALLIRLAANKVCNDHGSDLIGQTMEPFIQEAAEREHFRLLFRQSRPVVMNIKGASASGKSTMRPLQQKLAEEIGIAWQDFAVISPDIWRKFLLDYDTLGEAYKYAGTLTGHEVEIINQKLDRYMAAKAQKGAMPHLLIDRFRFDSFAAEPDAEEGSNLLTRFGDEIYMFFMITPPEATVERAWRRGLQFGRYKAVDDLLDHNVEAFTGMPRLFFTWALRADKTVHYEFLDNSVDKGQRPKTVAFGCNGDMTILHIKPLIDINRYQKINIDALSPAEVYPDSVSLKVENNISFLRQCAERIKSITFADQKTGKPYALMERGNMVWSDPAGYRAAMTDEETRAAITAMDPRADAVAATLGDRQPPAAPDPTHTLGQWGPVMPLDAG
ncbi:MAG: hypothetical protein O3C34_18510 [Proteobacteria bacterium]|nr:hypothetical protein [Pseudomonadota bacterium]